MHEQLLFDTVMALQGEVRHLRQLVHFQKSQLDALRIYAIANLADLKRADRAASFAEFQKIAATLYDEHISKLEAQFPAIASDIDVRGTMTQQQQEFWYLLDKYYPKKDPPKDG